MKKKATLKQIAKELNVSVSTVSKALNDSPEISEPTKIKVKEFAKLKKYKPNITALNLKNRSTKTIGLIVPNILNSFFAKVFKGIEKVADEKGYHIITVISDESLLKEKHTLQMLSNGIIDGFIMAIAEESQKEDYYQHINETINDGTPIVIFDRIIEQIKCDKVIVDDFESGVNATQHLIDTGCKNIALFSTIDNLSVGKLRAAGFLKALENNNITPNSKHIILCDDEKDFEIKTKKFFDENKIDGAFALDEPASTLILKKALKKGLKIPEDFSIIGFADGVWSKRLTPSMSTVSQHGPEVGRAAAKLLIERLENNEEGKKYQTSIIKTELRLRESTKNKN
jgi:LacI family transcriptional regulator